MQLYKHYKRCKLPDNTPLMYLAGLPVDLESLECNNLLSLQGSPLYIVDNYECSIDGTEFTGAPQCVGGDFRVDMNENITHLIGGPQYVGGDYSCSNNSVTQLQGAPLYVGGSFSCSNNPITDFTHLPRYIEFDLYCSSIPGQTWAETQGFLHDFIKKTNRFVGGNIYVSKIDSSIVI